MTLWNDLKPYRDKFNLVAPGTCSQTEGPASGNGILYTGEAMVLSKRIGEIPAAPEFISTVWKCMSSPGLLKRAPEGQTDQEGPDDYIGLAAGAWATGWPRMAKFVLDHGVTHFGVFNNVNPGKFTWSAFLWRQPQLIAHFMWAAGMKPWLPLRLYWSIVIALSSWRRPVTDTDSRILAWLMIQVMDGRSWIGNQAVKVFRKRLMRDYEEGMRSVARLYFQPGHPMIAAWPVF